MLIPMNDNTGIFRMFDNAEMTITGRRIQPFGSIDLFCYGKCGILSTIKMHMFRLLEFMFLDHILNQFFRPYCLEVIGTCTSMHTAGTLKAAFLGKIKGDPADRAVLMLGNVAFHPVLDDILVRFEELLIFISAEVVNRLNKVDAIAVDMHVQVVLHEVKDAVKILFIEDALDIFHGVINRTAIIDDVITFLIEQVAGKIPNLCFRGRRF